ncbi:MAG TPA: hypothetical protein VH143_20280 [Kofleriaceae bacterium]|jgi:hypothetical protein|nr:hypothetical protein [Kofleriaceae bacterium]
MQASYLVAFSFAAGCSTWSQPLFRDPFPASPPPSAPRYSQQAATASEHELFAAINGARRDAGLAPLAWSDEASFVAHDPKMKFDFAGLVYSDIRLDLALTQTPSNAITYWLGDADRRANLMSDATHLGVAVVPDGPDNMMAVAVTVREPPPLAGVTQLKHRIADAIAVDDWGYHRDEIWALDNAAQLIAEGLAVHKPHRDIYDDYVANAPGGAGTAVFATTMPDPSRLVSRADLRALVGKSPYVRGFGVGIAQGPDRSHGDGQLYVVVTGCYKCVSFD